MPSPYEFAHEQNRTYCSELSKSQSAFEHHSFEKFQVLSGPSAFIRETLTFGRLERPLVTGKVTGNQYLPNQQSWNSVPAVSVSV